MTRLRGFVVAFWLALALLVGQQAALLHDLGHATEQLGGKKDSKHAPVSCDKCFAAATLSGAVGATMPQVPAVVADTLRDSSPPHRDASIAPRLAFRSRAPPTLL